MYDTLTLIHETHGEDPDWIFMLNHLLYADDTALLASSTPRMHALLTALEKVAARYGLRLNDSKFVRMALGTHEPLTFRDGTLVTRVTEATYLGCHLNIKSDHGKELRRSADLASPGALLETMHLPHQKQTAHSGLRHPRKTPVLDGLHVAQSGRMQTYGRLLLPRDPPNPPGQKHVRGPYKN